MRTKTQNVKQLDKETEFSASTFRLNEISTLNVIQQDIERNSKNLNDSEISTNLIYDI